MVLVSFPNHAGYFCIPPSADAARLKKQVLRAYRDKEEISFTFDQKLNILAISDNADESV